MNLFKLLAGLFVFLLITHCNQEKKTNVKKEDIEEKTEQFQDKIENAKTFLQKKPEDISTPDGMVWIPGGIFSIGAVPHDTMAMNHEKPAHTVAVDGFFIDITEVTNSQFNRFVDATKYKTIAERSIDWEEMRKQLPEGTPKPHDSIMQPGSLTFKKTKDAVTNLYDFSQWWNWTIGANWKHPNGPNSTIVGKDNEPVVHIAYEDAQAYCEWAGRRLPTEAEWERAAKGKNATSTYFWGDDDSQLAKMANTWEGQFPVENTKVDGFEARAPVKSFAPNDFGLYDMAGNVWEWTSDWYNTNYYQELSNKNQVVRNPKGAQNPFNNNDPYAREKVMKGGSFLCNASYCANYRISARMATSLDSSTEHLGFRTVASIDMMKVSEEK